MASSGRRTDPSLEESLFERGYEFEFFQAVRLLAGCFRDRKQVGGTAKPAGRSRPFSGPTVLAFPASAVHDIEHTPDSPDPARMTVAFMALTGTQGILPFCYTEFLLARKAGKDDTLAAFLDLFNHRLMSLFYRAWEKHHPTVLYESSCDARPPTGPVHAISFRSDRHGHGGLARANARRRTRACCCTRVCSPSGRTRRSR